MTNSKHTKRALLASVLSVALCLVMLIGTTFAWFTASVTSAGNTIASGRLNIDLLVKDGEDYVSVSGDKAIFDYALWEPGYTDVKNVKVATDGELALQYNVTIVPKGTDAADALKLAEVIDVYYAAEEVAVEGRDLSGLEKVGTLKDILEGATVISGTLIPAESKTEAFATIALKMQETAGNEYQGLTVGEGFDIQLVATQYTYEADSFDDQYDSGATYPALPPIVNGTVTVKDAATLLTIAKNPASYENVTIELANDIDLGGAQLPSLQAGDGDTLTFNGNGHTISNATVSSNKQNGMENHGMFYAWWNSTLTVKDLTLENITVSGPSLSGTYGNAVLVGYADTNSKVSFENVDLKNCTVSGRKAALYVGHSVGSVTLTDCDAESCKTSGLQSGLFVANINSTDGVVTFENCTKKACTPNNKDVTTAGNGAVVNGTVTEIA